MKKFFTVMLLAVGIFFGSQFATNEKVFAADVYAGASNGLEYYVWAIDHNGNPKGTDIGGYGINYNKFTNMDTTWGVTEAEANKAFIAKLKVVQNGKAVSTNEYSVRFVSHDGYVFYVYMHNDEPKDFGRISAKENVKKIYEAAKKFLEVEQQEKELEQIAANAVKLVENGKFNDAVNQFNAVIKQQPNNYAAYYGLGVTYEMMQKYPEAIKALQKSISMNPTPDAYKWLGISYSGLNDGNNAIKNLSQAVSIKPTDHQACFYLAMAYINFQKDYNKAAEYCEKAIASYPRRDFQYYRILGICSLNTEKYSKAVDAFSTAIELNSKDGELYASRAFAYEFLGENKKAEKDYKAALKYSPGFAPAKEGLERVKK